MKAAISNASAGLGRRKVRQVLEIMGRGDPGFPRGAGSICVFRVAGVFAAVSVEGWSAKGLGGLARLGVGEEGGNFYCRVLPEIVGCRIGVGPLKADWSYQRSKVQMLSPWNSERNFMVIYIEQSVACLNINKLYTVIVIIIIEYHSAPWLLQFVSIEQAIETQ